MFRRHRERLIKTLFPAFALLSIFDLPSIACGMLFSVNMWADEFSAPNLVKAVPALQMHSQ